MKNTKPLLLKCECFNLNSLKTATNTQSDLSLVASFEDKVSQENPILSNMADWESPSQTPVGFPQSHTVEVKNFSNV